MFNMWLSYTPLLSNALNEWLHWPCICFFPGYLPQNLYSLNSAYGSEHLLKGLLQKMKQHNVRAMADIVINHRVGTSKGHGGMYNRYDGIPLPWGEHAVTSCTGGLVWLHTCHMSTLVLCLNLGFPPPCNSHMFIHLS